MLCYMDRTYCQFWASCEDGASCPRALTAVVLQSAEVWWVNQFRGEPGGAPIAHFGGKPDCYVALTVKEEHYDDREIDDANERRGCIGDSPDPHPLEQQG